VPDVVGAPCFAGSNGVGEANQRAFDFSDSSAERMGKKPAVKLSL
jgi:hypothetical protein